ncbi:NAD(P)H-binding protein [Tsuneonella sp. HG222]
MSDVPRILLAGATGLVGGKVMALCNGRDDLRLVALTRREAPMPGGARMEMMVAEPARWDEAVSLIGPDAAICALGTTWKKAGKDEAAFRLVDEELVLRVARSALTSGVRNFVFVSSVGAETGSKTFYLRIKGEVEQRLRKLGFHRLDILRPGLLRGQREGDRRLTERAGIAVAPLANVLLRGERRRYRAIDARVVAEAALQCTREKARGTFVHEHDSLLRYAHRFASGQ